MVQFLKSFVKILKYIDIYGQKIELNFQKKNIFKTAFGGFLTFIVTGFFLIGCWFYGKELIYKQNPSVISSQRPVYSAKRIDITPNNLIILISISNHLTQPFVDPTIFTIRAVQEQFVLYNDTETGRTTKKLIQINKQIRLCTNEDIGISGLQDYFSLLNLPLFYCFDKDVYMEGDFDADKFSQIYVYVEKCKNSTLSQVVCQSPQEIDEKLKLTKALVFMSDNNINPLDFQEPISTRGIALYSQTSSFFPKELQFYFTNSYIESDVGIVFEQIEIKQTYTFVEMKETPFFSDPNVLARLQFRIQKQKENLMQRRYLKLADVVAQIGGLLKILLTLGTLVSFPITKLYLLKAIVDEVFQFDSKNVAAALVQKDDNLTKDKKFIPTPPLPLKKKIKDNKPHIKQEQEIKIDKLDGKNHSQSFSNQIISAQNQLNSQSAQSPNLTIDENMQEQNKYSTANGISQKMESLIQQAKDYFQYSHKVIRYQFFHFFAHSFFPKIRQIKIKYKLVEEGVTKVQDHLDILFILNKLLEVDKIKSILLNPNQLKLFEFIPKPIITDENIVGPESITNLQENLNKRYSQQCIQKENSPNNRINQKQQTSQNQTLSLEQNKNIQQNLSKNTNFSIDEMKRITIDKNIRTNTQKVYSLYKDNITQSQKAEEAYEGLKKILIKNKLSKIDENLMNLIDPSILQSFYELNKNCENQLDIESINSQNLPRESKNLILKPQTKKQEQRIDEYNKKSYFQANPQEQLKKFMNFRNQNKSISNNIIQLKEIQSDRGSQQVTPVSNQYGDSFFYSPIIPLQPDQENIQEYEEQYSQFQGFQQDFNQIYFTKYEDSTEQINKQSIYKSMIKQKQLARSLSKINSQQS